MSDDPNERADQALTTALEQVENVDGGRIEQATAEQDAATTLIEGLVEAVAIGMSKSRAGARLGTFADATGFTKTELRDLFSESVEEAGPDASGDPLGAFLDEQLVEVQIARSTDKTQDATYAWRFEDFTIETAATGGSGRHHLDARQFRLEIFAASNILPAKPSDDLLESWDEYISAVINDYRVETVTKGRRSSAVDELRNFVAGSVGYRTPEDAGERNGIYIPKEREYEGEIWVPNERVLAICDEFDLSATKQLQMELDARGVTSDRVRGASHSTFVNGQKRTYWVLDDGFADPVDIKEEPVEPAERTQKRIEAEEAALADGNGEFVDEDDEEAERAEAGGEDEDAGSDEVEEDDSPVDGTTGSPADRATFSPLYEDGEDDADSTGGDEP